LQTRLFCAKPESSTNTSPIEKAEGAGKEFTQNGSIGASTEKSKRQGTVATGIEYPTEKEDGDAGFFPMREPGDFPSTEIVKIQDKEEVEEYDPLRDGPLRYLGYANELGEAFAAWLFPGGVPLSYAIAVGYVLFDTRDKGIKAYSEAKSELQSSYTTQNGNVNTQRLTSLLGVERAIDTVVWQLLASVIIPGYTIHMVVAFVHYLLETGLHIDSPSLMAPALLASLSSVAATVNSNTDTVAALVDKSVPTFIGVATIPFIVHPIDETVHAILNVSMRPALRKFLCENGQGTAAGLKICDENCMLNDFPVLSDDNTIIEAFTKSFEEAESP